MTIAIEGYKAGDGVADYMVNLTLDMYAPTYFSANWEDLVTLRLVSLIPGIENPADIGEGMQIVMDHLIFNENSTTVPEPAALGLLGLGAIFIAAGRHRKAA